MAYWLENTVDDQGYWIESSHYASVSWAYFVLYVIISRNSGYHDFLKDPKFKRMCEFYTKTNTPPDPLCKTNSAMLRPETSKPARVDAPYGRGVRGDAYDYAGLLARATVTSDPEFSKRMQRFFWVAYGGADLVS
jgi:hypothetical protein